jgi:hypothetical protein
MASESIQIQILRIFSLCALGVKPGVQQCAPASEASGSKVLRGGVALRRRRLPVDRLEYSHAGVPVAQGICRARSIQRSRYRWRPGAKPCARSIQKGYPATGVRVAGMAWGLRRLVKSYANSWSSRMQLGGQVHSITQALKVWNRYGRSCGMGVRIKRLEIVTKM